MKFPINLASQPFHKDRPILFASGAVAVLMVGCLLLLTSLALADRHRSRDTRRAIAQLDRQIESTAAEQTRLDALLRRPENAEVLERSLGLNLLLYRKGISWTHLFADLEKTFTPQCPARHDPAASSFRERDLSRYGGRGANTRSRI